MLGQVGKYSEITNICPQKYFCARKHFQLPRIFFLLWKHFYLSPKIYFVHEKNFNLPRIFVFAPRKHFDVLRKLLGTPRNLIHFLENFCSSQIFCVTCADFFVHMCGFFVSSHFGQAVMPWLGKWSGAGIFGIVVGVLNTCLWRSLGPTKQTVPHHRLHALSARCRWRWARYFNQYFH